ncbi:MAG: hypothetical protein GEU28_00940 [Dehalococcoidia bacterium]|nr:hypothetical protein [Dehalococcoidia bacterium]
MRTDSEETSVQRDEVQDFVAAVRGSQHWFDALLDTIPRWRLSEETIGDRQYRYLVGGEAFDWLLLAERLLDEVADFVPDKERQELLFEGRWPEGFDAEAFRERVGPARHAAHLNFQYGVVVEQVLQLAFEQEAEKERASHVWGAGIGPDAAETAIQRLYGKSRGELVRLFREQRPELIVDAQTLGLADLKEFTYWMFKHRVENSDPARVASDTRRGLALLSRMELETRSRRRAQGEDEPARFVEITRA